MLYVYGGWAGLVGKRGNPPSHIPSEGRGTFEEMDRGQTRKTRQQACFMCMADGLGWWVGEGTLRLTFRAKEGGNGQDVYGGLWMGWVGGYSVWKSGPVRFFVHQRT